MTQQMSFADVFRGSYGISKPPIDDIDSYWSPQERIQVNGMLARSIVGDAVDVRTGIEALVRETDADELMIVSDVYHHDQRLRSFELIAAAMRELNGISVGRDHKSTIRVIVATFLLPVPTHGLLSMIELALEASASALWLAGAFTLRHQVMRYYSGREGVPFPLNPVLTAFFGPWCVSGHLRADFPLNESGKAGVGVMRLIV